MSGIKIGWTLTLLLPIVLVNCRSTAVPQRTPDSVAPHGYFLLYTSDASGGNQDIWSLDLTSRQVRNLSNHPRSDVSPTWWAIRRRIVFGSSRTGQGDIYSMRPDGSDQKVLFGGPNTEHSPAISPDGTHLAYVESAGAVSLIKVINLATNQQTFSTIGANPAWSPDGTRLSYNAHTSGQRASLKEAVFVSTVSGQSNTTQISHPSNDVVHGYVEAAWHPNGESLLYSTGFGSNRGLFLFNLLSSSGSSVSDGLGHDRLPSISPEGRFAAAVSNLSPTSVGGFLSRIPPGGRDWGLVVIDLSTVRREIVVASGVHLSRPLWLAAADLR